MSGPGPVAEELRAIHARLADVLLVALKAPKVDPRTLATARRFLSDNGVNAATLADDPAKLRALAATLSRPLPFSGDDGATT